MKNGDDPHVIAAKIPCGVKSVNHWIKRYIESGTVENKPRSGRPRLTNENVDINIVVEGVIEKFIVPKQIKADLDLDVSDRTVRRRLDEAGISGRVSRKTYPFSEVHIRKRLSFGNGYRNWTVDQWATVLFSDETHVEMGEHGQIWVQRPIGAAFDYQYMSHKVPHPDRVFIWGCFCKAGVGCIAIFQHKLNATYMKKILVKNLFRSAKLYFPEPTDHWWFLQDNDPKHKSRLVQNWLFSKGVRCIDFPPYSPDMNPIENLWYDLKKRVGARNGRTVDELIQHIEHEWEATDTDFLVSLVESMPDRCQAVIDKQGHMTDY